MSGESTQKTACTCVIVALGDNTPGLETPNEWEQDPWCSEHFSIPSLHRMVADIKKVANQPVLDVLQEAQYPQDPDTF